MVTLEEYNSANYFPMFLNGMLEGDVEQLPALYEYEVHKDRGIYFCRCAVAESVVGYGESIVASIDMYMRRLRRYVYLLSKFQNKLNSEQKQDYDALKTRFKVITKET